MRVRAIDEAKLERPFVRLNDGSTTTGLMLVLARIGCEMLVPVGVVIVVGGAAAVVVGTVTDGVNSL